MTSCPRSLSYFVPTLIHRGCVQRSFDCLVSAEAYPLFQTLWFGFVGNGSAEWECRQDQIGLGAEVATSFAPCGRFDPGSQLPVAALRTWRAGPSPPVMILGAPPNHSFPITSPRKP